MKDKIIFVCFAESTLCAVTECCLGRHKVPPHDHPANIYRVERKMQLALPRQVSALNKTTHMCKGRHTGICFQSSYIKQHMKKLHNKRKMPILKAKEIISKLQ